MGTPSRSGGHQLILTKKNEFTFAVYSVSINDNYVMGRDGGGSIINLEPHEMRKARRMQKLKLTYRTLANENSWLVNPTGTEHITSN